MVVRDGKVAFQQRSKNNIPKSIEIKGIIYTSNLKNNVLLVWIPEESAESLINSPNNKAKSCDCNGGSYDTLFYPASEINVNIHEKGTP